MCSNKTDFWETMREKEKRVLPRHHEGQEHGELCHLALDGTD
jgi:hypothetical protein